MAEKEIRGEHVEYEAPALMDPEALARAAGCGVCITGGSAAQLAEAAERPTGPAPKPAS